MPCPYCMLFLLSFILNVTMMFRAKGVIAMLSLKHICKFYDDNHHRVVALDNINLTMEAGEFVALLGPSGCGKTTLLNIIGGLDTYSQHDFYETGKTFLTFRKSELTISGRATRNFSEREWDRYRNNHVGFVFQHYNLIPHLTVLDNVMLGMTLSGVDKATRRTRAETVLKQVGLLDKAQTKNAQLSSGQRQKAAIARALVNEPDILIADEPTGALDSEAGRDIMQLLREIAQDKLVIMATHNEELAQAYASRIVRMKDGQVVEDTTLRTFEKQPESLVQGFSPIAMPISAAVHLSLKNLRMKRARSFLAVLAGAVGIAGVALVLSIASGLGREIERIEAETLAAMPIAIHRFPSTQTNLPLIDGRDFSYNFAPWFEPVVGGSRTHTNLITQEYVDHLHAMQSEWLNGISFLHGVRMPFVAFDEDGARNSLTEGVLFQPLQSSRIYLESQYSLQAGRYPEADDELVIIVDALNHIDAGILEFLGVEQTGSRFFFREVLDTEVLLFFNDGQHIEYDLLTGTIERSFIESATDHQLAMTVVGVLKGRPNSLETSTSGIFYLDTLEKTFIQNNQPSAFCEVLANIDLRDATRERRTEVLEIRRMHGCQTLPTVINIYPRSLETKRSVIAHLNDYNAGRAEEQRIQYTDLSAVLSGLLGTISTNVTTVLFALGVVAVLVSASLVAMLVYNGLVERTKEIGILRSLGARRRDVARMFNVEALLIGLLAGIVGIGFAYLLSIPINRTLSNILVGFDRVVRLQLPIMLMLVLFSVVITFLSGLLPALAAARRHPAAALRHHD